MPVPFEGTSINSFRAVENKKSSLPEASKVKKDKENKSKKGVKVSPFNPKKKVIQEV